MDDVEQMAVVAGKDFGQKVILPGREVTLDDFRDVTKAVNYLLVARRVIEDEPDVGTCFISGGGGVDY